MSCCLIYIIKNKSNGKVYIGQTWRTLEERAESNGRGYRDSVALWNAIKKYGWANFDHIVITVAHTQEMADYWEDFFIVKYNSIDAKFGYNARRGGSHGKHNEVSKRKLSEAHTGKKHSEEHKANISAGNMGRVQSEETRKKISKGHTGKIVSETTKKKLSDMYIGKSFSVKTEYKRGNKPPCAKITPELAEQIRTEYANEDISRNGLAKRYGVVKSTIDNVLSKKFTYIYTKNKE